MLVSSMSIEISSDSVVFCGEGGRISIEVGDYERPEAVDYHDANWLIASISIVAGSFGGTFTNSIAAYELVELHRQLDFGLKALRGHISFDTMERDLSLAVEFLERGKARISGEARPHRAPASKLIFAFNSDQSYLAQTLEQIAAVVRRFPVKS